MDNMSSDSDNPPVTLGGFLETFDNGRLPTIPIDSLAEAVGKSWSGDGELNLSRSLERHGLNRMSSISDPLYQHENTNSDNMNITNTLQNSITYQPYGNLQFESLNDSLGFTDLKNSFNLGVPLIKRQPSQELPTFGTKEVDLRTSNNRGFLSRVNPAPIINNNPPKPVLKESLDLPISEFNTSIIPDSVQDIPNDLPQFPSNNPLSTLANEFPPDLAYTNNFPPNPAYTNNIPPAPAYSNEFPPPPIFRNDAPPSLPVQFTSFNPLLSNIPEIGSPLLTFEDYPNLQPNPSSNPFANNNQSPHAMTYQSPHAVTYQSPNAMVYQPPNAVTYQSPQAVTYQSPNAVTYQSPNAMTYQSPHSVYSGSPSSVNSGSPYSGSPCSSRAIAGKKRRTLIAIINNEKVTSEVLDMKKPETKRRWTPEEDALLIAAVQKYGEGKWVEIAKEVPGRNNTQVNQRWNKVLKPGVKKGVWSAEEDQLLLKGVEMYGLDFERISKLIPGRAKGKCRDRYFEHLSPEVNKTPWTAEEDQLLLELQSQWNNNWAGISKQFPGRSANAVRTRFNTLTRHRKI